MRSYYQDTIQGFVASGLNDIIGRLTRSSGYGAEELQLSAWESQILILQSQLENFNGKIFFEFAIPRMGRRVDVVLLIDSVVVVIEFKVGERRHNTAAVDQVWDYALDLKNFHSSSHDAILIPVLVATEAKPREITFKQSMRKDGVVEPVLIAGDQIRQLLDLALTSPQLKSSSVSDWEQGRYLPTPTIVEAALALYGGHNVEEILRSDAGAQNLAQTVGTLQSLIVSAKEKKNEKIICFVTGVPGAGKTLVGLDIATKNINKEDAQYSVYLSGNGPLVKVLQEALARDKVARARASGERLKKGEARNEVELFIQNVHEFRDECIQDPSQPPPEHVVIFDESQRAWDLAMTADFMQRRRKTPIRGFNQSEPEYLISCMNRHKDWAVIICLVGGGQEINRGEAGIQEWISAIERSFRDWKVFCSPELVEKKYLADLDLSRIEKQVSVTKLPDLHLATSMRSFRAARLSDMVNSILALDIDTARTLHAEIRDRYPLLLTRDVEKARAWLRQVSRGTQRFGLVVSSKAYRLRPHAIDVRKPADPVHWFLDGKEDIRSSYYLEDVATEFQIQGLELDWAAVTWDADLRYSRGAWSHHQFVGSAWQKINKPEKQQFLENAYRVLLTRARQGMVLVVPEGADVDPTRNRAYYDPTYKLFKEIGFQEI